MFKVISEVDLRYFNRTIGERLGIRPVVGESLRQHLDLPLEGTWEEDEDNIDN